MTSLDELKTTVRRNKLLGMWAAGKLGLAGPDAEAYADALAVGAVDPERSDVFSKVRKDFDAAGRIPLPRRPWTSLHRHYDFPIFDRHRIG
jgi:hypothetical protein